MRRLSSRGLPFFACLLFASSLHGDELPPLPMIERLHYRRVIPSLITTVPTVEQIVDADHDRSRFEIYETGGDGGAPFRVAIRIVLHEADRATEYLLDPAGKTAVRRILDRGEESAIEAFRRELYPHQQQRLLAEADLEVIRAGSETIDGINTFIYTCEVPMEHHTVGLKWWLGFERGAWIPVQYGVFPLPKGARPHRFFDVRLNEPIDDALFGIPGGYIVTEAAVAQP